MSTSRVNDMPDDEEPHRIRKADAAKTITIGVAAISVGLCIPLYFARRSSRTSLPSSASLPVTEGVSLVRKASPADLLSGKARPARPFSPSSPSSAADIPFNSSAAVEESFNPAFYTFGAFGLATAAVWASAALGVFAVHRITGASSLEDFSLVVRSQIYRALPGLSEKLYGDVEAAPAGSGWSWDDAEKRLENAYEEGGLYKWATQAQEELNAEASTAQSVATNSR